MDGGFTDDRKRGLEEGCLRVVAVCMLSYALLQQGVSQSDVVYLHAQTMEAMLTSDSTGREEQVGKSSWHIQPVLRCVYLKMFVSCAEAGLHVHQDEDFHQGGR